MGAGRLSSVREWCVRSRILILSGLVLAALAVLIGSTIASLATYRAQAVTMAEDVSERAETPVTEDEEERPQKTTTVPSLVTLLGMNLDDALVSLGRGATVQAATPVAEGAEASEAVILLSAEYAPAGVAQPTVVLGFDGAGLVVRAGYEASMASLGYGALSFADAIENVGVGESALVWEATLTYDYEEANASGNLADTERLLALNIERQTP